MAIPIIDLRLYFRKWTREDAVKGIVFERLPTGPQGPGGEPPPTDLFVRVGLQFRYAMKVDKTYEWSAWQDVPLVREGDDEPTADPANKMN